MISDRELLRWGEYGIFPGPRESVSGFLQRAESGSISSDALVPSLFQMTPHWIKIQKSSKNLHLWEAAATWIEELEQGKIDCQIQIHPRHSKSSVLAHEMVHAVRMGFEEPYFEEILAYQTASHPIRRYLGPLFLKTYEPKVFLSFVLFSWSLALTEILFDWDIGGFYFLFLPILFIAGCSLRLFVLQRTFQKCLANLKEIIREGKDPLSMAIRLTDAEIQKFAKASSSEILEAMLSYQKEETTLHSIRWRQIFLEFFTL